MGESFILGAPFTSLFTLCFLLPDSCLFSIPDSTCVSHICMLFSPPLRLFLLYRTIAIAVSFSVPSRCTVTYSSAFHIKHPNLFSLLLNILHFPFSFPSFPPSLSQSSLPLLHSPLPSLTPNPHSPPHPRFSFHPPSFLYSFGPRWNKLWGSPSSRPPPPTKQRTSSLGNKSGSNYPRRGKEERRGKGGTEIGWLLGWFVRW